MPTEVVTPKSIMLTEYFFIAQLNTQFYMYVIRLHQSQEKECKLDQDTV